MKVHLALLALAACCSANPLWVYPYSPYGTTVRTAAAPTCRESFQEIKTKYCEPTFQIVCDRYKQPSQTIDLKRECTEVPSIVCGSHKHEGDDFFPISPAAPGEDGTQHGHDSEGNVVFDAASATASTVAGTPYIGGFVPYQLRTLASQHCHEVKKEYCYMVPRVRDVDREVDNCHVETRATCKDVTHYVPVPICEDQVQGPVIAPPAETVDESEASAQSAAAPRTFVPFRHISYVPFGGK